jgi:tRNA1(Val) A37 N6-methylase TrmN6
MLDIAHYLHDRDLQQTLQHVYDCLKNRGRLIIRVTVPPKRRVPVLYWIEEARLWLTRVPSFYRTGDALKVMLAEAHFKVEQTFISGGQGELCWLTAVKKSV